MRRLISDSYSIDKDTYTIEVDYRYYSDSGSWEQPPEEDIEIKKVEYNGIDITELFWDFMDYEAIEDEVMEYVKRT